MKAVIKKSHIEIIPTPKKSRDKLWVVWDKSKDKYTHPKAYTLINAGQYKYDFPPLVEKKNIKKVWISRIIN